MTDKRTGLVDFFGQVRAEARKVTWTSRQETMIASIMVMIMVVLSAAFFLLADELLSRLVRFITRA